VIPPYLCLETGKNFLNLDMLRSPFLPGPIGPLVNPRIYHGPVYLAVAMISLLLSYQVQILENPRIYETLPYLLGLLVAWLTYLRISFLVVSKFLDLLRLNFLSFLLKV